MTAPKRYGRPIPAAAVARLLDEACLARLARLTKLPPDADRVAFAEGVRTAAIIYAHDAAAAHPNRLHREIAALKAAARAQRYEQTAAFLRGMSAEALALVHQREVRLKGRLPPLPPPDALDDPVRRDAACATIAALLSVGGRIAPSRNRPSGKRSQTWRSELLAPPLQQRPTRRAAERMLAQNLSLALLEATGAEPALTAHPDKPGPFARLVAEVLRLVGAPHVNAVKVINALNRLRH